MKLVKFVSVVMTLVFIMSALQIVSFAQDDTTCDHCSDEITVLVDESASEEIKNRIYAHFYGDGEDAIQSRGITCTLFGHDIDIGTVSTITHKVRSSAPRCLKETFNYEICSRCDYEVYTQINSEYIYCC